MSDRFFILPAWISRFVIDFFTVIASLLLVLSFGIVVFSNKISESEASISSTYLYDYKQQIRSVWSLTVSRLSILLPRWLLLIYIYHQDAVENH